MKSDELQNEVTTTFAQLREKGITGVPMTIIDGKWAVQGGQSSDVYVQVSFVPGLGLTFVLGELPLSGNECWVLFLRYLVLTPCMFQIFKKLAACHASGGACTNSPMPTHLVESLVV